MKNFLKQQRSTKDLTQQELAEKVEVSRQTIHSIESGRYIPSTLLALKLAAVLGVKVEDLFLLEKED
jgi:putative transcriptional regulator